MKLISFVPDARFGVTKAIGAVIDEERAVDLTLSYREYLLSKGLSREASTRIATTLIPENMVDFIEGGDVSREAAEIALSWAHDHDWDAPWILRWKKLKRLCPIPRPPLLRDFMAFEEHLQNIYPKLGRQIPPQWYKIPVYYKGNPASVSTDGDPIVLPPYETQLDFEFELAFVIGRSGRDIPLPDARSYVYGFMIYNDFSARAIQSEEMAVGLGPAKGKDFTSAHSLGPWLVTRDELPDIEGLAMVARVNGEEWVRTQLFNMYWSIEQMIHHASQAEVIQAGEVWGLGTIGGGSGMERGQFLQAGDYIELEVERLGTLGNPIVASEERR
ncbi:MAG: fumarylacetoacetate hydrolase family protein [Firmicutes bacterium]|nr:fumarylacetoacetate hydrolase family protein [Bacillota bacterium]